MIVLVEVGARLDHLLAGQLVALGPDARPGSRSQVYFWPRDSSSKISRLHLDEIDDADGARPLRRPGHLDRRPARRRGGRASSCTFMSKFAPSLSILLTNTMRGTWNLSAWRQTVSVCGSTPLPPSSTATAPSSTRRRALDLDREVDVARGVDDVDPVADDTGVAGRRGGLPEAVGRRRRDGDARAPAPGPCSPWSRRRRGPHRSCGSRPV